VHLHFCSWLVTADKISIFIPVCDMLFENVCRSQTADSSRSGKPLQVEIKDDSALLQLPNVLAMACVESRIAVLFTSADHVSVTLYTVSEVNMALSQPRMYQVYTCRDSELSSIAVPVPHIAIVMSTAFHQKSLYQCSGRSSKVLRISDELFNVLFGFELNLSRCPVLLLCGPSGLVLWLPMKSVIGNPSKTHVLCHLGDRLVHAISLSIGQNDGASPLPSHLVLVGHRGHIVVISFDSDKPTPSFQHYDLLGPVQCCTSADNWYLLYSTFNELYLTDIGQSVRTGQRGSMTSTALGISGIVAFTGVQSSEANNRTAVGQLPSFYSCVVT